MKMNHQSANAVCTCVCACVVVSIFIHRCVCLCSGRPRKKANTGNESNAALTQKAQDPGAQYAGVKQSPQPAAAQVLLLCSFECLLPRLHRLHVVSFERVFMIIDLSRQTRSRRGSGRWC